MTLLLKVLDAPENTILSVAINCNFRAKRTHLKIKNHNIIIFNNLQKHAWL